MDIKKVEGAITTLDSYQSLCETIDEFKDSEELGRTWGDLIEDSLRDKIVADILEVLDFHKNKLEKEIEKL